jgi:serine/threonine protein kinase/Tfp pilus assembly protein PilF
MAVAHEPPAKLELSGRPSPGPTPAFQAQVARPAPAIPDYELLRTVGRGAYGEVWLARNLTGSFVAVKVVARAAFDYDRPFEREFEGIKRFEPISRSDPAQVAVLHVGRGDGFFYYVMELADGAENPKAEGRNPKEIRTPKPETPAPKGGLRASGFGIPAALDPRFVESYVPHTLREDLKRHGRLPVAQCVQIGLALARALAHLHKCGLVHRDVKPSNVIFVGGVPKLADIGLVASVDATRSLVGTEGYVAPEGPGTPQADLYSLGKLLYEVSTGCDRKEFPALPPDIATRPDRDALIELNAIVMRACQFDPRERYASADAMLAELALLQRGQSVKGRHVWQNRIRSLRRIGFAAMALFLAAAGAIFLWQTMEQRGPSLPLRANEDGTAGTRIAKAAEAYRLGLPGLRRGTSEGYRQALVNFTAATEADPAFVAAYARLFETQLMSEDHGVYIIAGKTAKLSERSAKLVKLAPANAETYAAAAIAHFLNEWKWKEAESEFKRALDTDPNCRMALTYYGYFLTRLRRPAEARGVLQRALQLDPTSALITKFLGHCEFVERRYEKALPFYLRASELEPSFPSGYYWAGRVYLAMTNYAQALDEFKKHEGKQGLDAYEIEQRYTKLGRALDKGGPRGYWTQRLEMAREDELWRRTPYWYAERYARLGDKAQALDWLEKALTERDSMENLLVDEFWDDFRGETRFKNALRKVGLDPWAR